MTQVYLLYCCFIFLILVDNVSATFLSALKENSQSVAVSFFQGLIGLVLGYFLLQQVGLIGLLASSIAALPLTNLWINPYILLRKIKCQIVA
jgi:O-antigen/teichoic acid export membrane protein